MSTVRDHDLAWYVTEADGDLGAHGQTYEPSSNGEGQAHPGPSSRAIEAAGRYRVIAEALSLIDPRHRRVIERYYAVVPPAVRRAFPEVGDLLLGVVLGLVGDPALLASRCLAARGDADARDRIARLKAEASTMVVEAHRAYREARRSLDRERQAGRRARQHERLTALLRGAV